MTFVGFRPILVGLVGAVVIPVGLLGASSALKATRSSPGIQNRRADADDLSRLRDLSMLNRFVRNNLLVKVPTSTPHHYLSGIPASYRYLRPWSKLFLDRLSQQYYSRFRKKLRVTSMVRTVTHQQSLQKRNGNAAAAHGDNRSSHLTGATLDISKKGMSVREQEWMRRVLLSLREQGYLYAIEEFFQPTFHIMVYKNYPQYVEMLQARNTR